jgi:uroporphyrinogen-III synthase
LFWIQLASMQVASAILSKTTAEEAIACKKWVMAIGQKVAEAAKEHGVAISEPEKAVLGEVSAAFGLNNV